MAALYCVFFGYAGKYLNCIWWFFYYPMKKVKLFNIIIDNQTCLCNVFSASAGLSFLQFCNLNSFRTKFILGFSFFMGISMPQYFREYVRGPQPGHIHGSSRWVRFLTISFLIFFSLLHEYDHSCIASTKLHRYKFTVHHALLTWSVVISTKQA